MGTVFEELIRRFNEENNEEAGEHFTPRDVVKLMAKLIFLPVAEKIESGTYLVYDGKKAVVEYESDSNQRHTEQVPLLEDGGIEALKTQVRLG